jgi:hypothetical protein
MRYTIDISSSGNGLVTFLVGAVAVWCFWDSQIASREGHEGLALYLQYKASSVVSISRDECKATISVARDELMDRGLITGEEPAL